MTGYETLVEGHGVFCVYGDTFYTPTSPDLDSWRAFDDDISGNNRWRQANSQFTAGSASSSGGPVDSRVYASGLPNASWLVLHLPYEVNLKGYSICPQDGQSPGNIQIWGSSDGGTSWSHLHSQTQTNGDNTAYQNYTITHEGHYSIIAYLILTLAPSTQTYPTATEVSIRDMKYFGTPGPTTLDKGSLTLGRSLDVPRISRYDVDTETPRPEKLLADFDTTVNSSPTDISGQGNHGAFYNGASYSAVDKAFDFDGTNDMIYTNSASSLPTGDAIYSMSAWVNSNNAVSGQNQVIVAFGSAWDGEQIASIYLRDGVKLGSDIGGNNIASTNAVITQTQWHHVVICKVGTGVLTTDKIRLYVDGVEITNKTMHGTGTTQALVTTKYLSVGAGFNSQTSPTNPFTGKISNFKLYNVALEPSEVQKLYRLGRTGRSMVISDTAVGIGKVPEAQLDVRGVASFERVGIATTNPGKTLDVNGRLRTRYSSGYKSGTFDSTALNMGYFSEIGTDMPQIGWEIHMAFSTTNSNSTVKIYGGYRTSGGVNSTASGTLYAISESSSWRWSKGNAHDYLSSNQAILVHESATGHSSYYAVIRVVNPHYTTADEGNGRVHVSSECMGTRSAVGATIWKSVGYLNFAAGDNGRFNLLRILSSSGNIKGQWTGFPITT
jgi:hypothetical protein